MEVNSPEEFRKSAGETDDARDAGLGTPEDIVRYDNIRYGEDNRWNLLDVYHLKGVDTPRPAIISIHGGGWVYGDKERYQYYCMDLAQRGFTVVNFSYRLAPEHIFPAALEDVNEVFVWIAEHGRQYQIDTERLFVVGDSAGGQLASQYLALLTCEEYRKLFDFSVPYDRLKVLGAGLNCGLYDTKRFIMEADEDDIIFYYLNHDRETCLDRMDTVSHVTGQFPPSFIMTSCHDFLYPHAEPMYRLLQERGVACRYQVYGGEDRPEIAHVFHLDIRLAEAALCNDEECEFFRSILDAQ